MKTLSILAITAITTLFTNAYALETENEKTEATKNELSRTTDKAINRIKEAVCMEGDAECLKQKAQHRIEETTDVVKDKSSEIKNKVDE
ncbi:MAG: hypothetical protein IPN42_01800 [Methylococcaceae bacterium]|nr:hypothetical protein [Methylococcaceae bacterium]